MSERIDGMWTNDKHTHANNENIAQLSEIMNFVDNA